MYVCNCEDPNCMKCGEGQGSRRESPNITPMALQESISNHLFLASAEKTLCFEAFRKVKEDIHNHFTRLHDALREREQNLCQLVEIECCDQMAKIDHYSTLQCVDKLLKRNRNPTRDSSSTVLAFSCEIDSILCQLQMFGKLSPETIPDASERPKDSSLSTRPVNGPLETKSKDGIVVAKSEATTCNFPEVLNLNTVDNTTGRIESLSCNASERMNAQLQAEFSVNTQANRDFINLEEGRLQFQKKQLSLIVEDLAKKNCIDPHFLERLRTLYKQIENLDCISVLLRDLKDSLKMSKGPSESKVNVTDEKNNCKHQDLLKGLKSLQIQMEEPEWDGQMCKKPNSEEREEMERLDSLQRRAEEALRENQKLKREHLDKNMMNKEQNSEKSADSTSNVEIEKDDSSDEGDMVIISKCEAATLLSQTVPVPPKKKYLKWSGKRPFFSCFPEKPQSVENNSPECPVSNEELPSTANLPSATTLLDCPNLLIASSNEQETPESSGKRAAGPESSIVSASGGVKKGKFTTWLASVDEPERVSAPSEANTPTSSIINDSEGLERRNLGSSISVAELKEVSSSSQCLGSSRGEGHGHNPSVALLSSFKKYLEKNPENNWLVSEKNSEQQLSDGNQCILNKNGPFLVDVEQWLSTKNKQKKISDWLYTEQV